MKTVTVKSRLEAFYHKEVMSTICKHLDEAFQISKERRGNIVSSISVSHTSIDLLHVVEEEEHLE